MKKKTRNIAFSEMGQSVGDVSPPASPGRIVEEEKAFPSLSDLGKGRSFDAESESPYKVFANSKEAIVMYNNLAADRKRNQY